ncbi:hypothetical protein H7E67_17880 [Clostridium gasigenes]|uniref:hypothetical protein n=1 Tax=Clostridium gasigenes TaxID=94869 RepID=UPI00162367B8|nr:hypothetical protein [Clostridium gasigenes]MBB6625288.1 hypothetical protein [Clostridium gasigenes]
MKEMAEEIDNMSIKIQERKPMVDIEKYNNMTSNNNFYAVIQESKNKRIEMFKVMDEQNADKRRKEEERVSREKESLDIQRESLQLQNIMAFFMQSINKDNKQIVENLQNLIDVVDIGFKVEEGNLALIEKELQSINKNTQNAQKNFIDIVKEKMTEKGVEYAMMYMLVGLKTLFLNS